MKLGTRWLYYWSKTLCGPLEALFTLLIFIVSKELKATLLQLTILAAVKPLVSFFSFYLSAIGAKKENRLKAFLIFLNLAGCIPCFLFPIVESTWFYIASYVLFITAVRAAYPAWMEILKNQDGMNSIRRTISKGVSINYGMLIAIPIISSYFMDHYPGAWKGLFPCFALLQVFNTISLLKIPLLSPSIPEPSHHPIKTTILSPLKEGWALCKTHPSFTQYLLMFFLGGAGLVAIQPVLPAFFNEELHLSYVELTLAFSLIKGCSFLATAPFWGRWKENLFHLNGYINILSTLFITGLLAATSQVFWVYAAFAAYGAMQAGCELSYNACGPVFSKNQASLPYSGVNLALLGVRGCIFPALGQTLCYYTNCSTVFIFAGALCLVSTFYAFYLDRQYRFDSQEAYA